MSKLSGEIKTIANPLVKGCWLSAPETVGLDITQKCNLNCRHCYKDSGQTDERELTTKEIFSLIDECSQIGVCFFFIAGGEPTMRPDLFDIINYARSKDIRAMVVSNGVYGKEILAKLSRAKPLQVSISLEGPKVINDRIRGNGSYQKAVASIKYFKEQVIDIRINMHLCQLNKDYGEAMVKLANKLGVIIKFSTIRPMGRAVNFEEMKMLSAGGFYVTVKKILDLKSRYPEVKIVSDFDAVIGQRPLYKIAGNDNSRCFAAQKEVTVNYQGQVYPCSFFSPFNELNAGNIKTQKLLDIWTNSSVLKMIRVKKLDSKCQTCRYFRAYCLGGCPAIGYALTGQICFPDPLCPKEYVDHNFNRSVTECAFEAKFSKSETNFSHKF